MYEIQIESEEFKEKRTVQQHQMVNQVREEPPPFTLPRSPISRRACRWPWHWPGSLRKE